MRVHKLLWLTVASALALSAIPQEAETYCGAMGGYRSFAAQKAAQRKAAQARQRQLREDQAGLQRLGYYAYKVDGIAGPATFAATRDFQRANGLNVDGTLGPQTRAAIASPSAKSASASRREDSGSQLRSDQAALKELGYYRIEVDGIVGPRTRSAIAEFREANGLPEGTTLDVESRKILHSGSARPKDG